MADGQVVYDVVFKEDGSSLNKITSNAKTAEKGLGDLASKFGAVAGATALLTPILNGGKELFNYAASVEQMGIAWDSIAKQDAPAMMEKINKVAAQTPYEIAEIDKSYKSLYNSGIKIGDIDKVFMTLGDTASGVGAPVEQVTRAFSQMQSKGKVTGEEMLQLSEAGVPAWKLLADAMGLSVAQVQDLSQKGKLGSKELGLLLGGMEKSFGGGMQKQASSFNGLMSTLSDTVKGVVTPAFLDMQKSIKPILSWIIEALPKINPMFIKIAIAVVSVAGAFTGLVGAISALQIIMPAISGAMGILSGVISSISFPIILLGVAVVGLYIVIKKNFESVKNLAFSLAGVFSNVFDKISTAFVAISKIITDNLSGIEDFVYGVFVGIYNSVETPIAQIIGAIDEWINIFEDQISSMSLGNSFSAIILGMQSVISAVGNFVNMVGKPIGEMFTNLSKTIVFNVFSIASTILEQFGKISNDASFGFVQMSNTISSIFNTLSTNVITIINLFSTQGIAIFNNFGNLVSLSIELFAENFLMIFNTLLPPILNTITLFTTTVATLFTQFSTVVITKIQEFSTILVTNWSTISSVFTTFTILLTNIGLVFTQTFDLFILKTGELISTLIPTLDYIMSKFNEIVPVVLNMVNNVVKFLNDMFILAQPIIALFQSLMTKAFDILKQVIPPIVKAIADAVFAMVERSIAFVNFLMPVIKGLADFFMKYMFPTISVALNTIMNVVGSVFNMISGIISGVLRVITGIVKTFTAVLKGDWKGAFDSLGGIVSGAFDAVKALVGGVFNIGKDIVSGIVKGLASSANAIKDFLLDMAKGAFDAVKNFFGIHSPSRLMRDEIGIMIGKGMAIGIDKSSKEVDKSAKSLAESAIENAKIDSVLGDSKLNNSIANSLSATVPLTSKNSNIGALNLTVNSNSTDAGQVFTEMQSQLFNKIDEYLGGQYAY